MCGLVHRLFLGKKNKNIENYFTVTLLKLEQAGTRSLPRQSKDDSDEAGIRACQTCMDCLERYGKRYLKLSIK